jgi:hypothetical protein
MDESVDNLLSKMTPDRRRFVQSILGLGGYAVPTVRTFLMATAAAVPALSQSVTTTSAPSTTPAPSTTLAPTTTPAPTTTHAATTTRNPWRPALATSRPGSSSSSLIPPIARPGLKK